MEPQNPRNLASKLCYFLWTLFLFTKSDIKCIITPIITIAVASTPLSNLNRLPHVIFWTWFHLLQFDVSNQTLKPEEDEYNKNFWPLPAKWITLQNALRLRWALVPACLVLSACYSVETVYASFAFCFVTFAYDELGFAAGHWISRNIWNAFGIVSIEIGACLVAGENPHNLDNIAWLSVLYSGMVSLTTIHAQDFRDIEGDQLVRRKTLPIVAPAVARPALVFTLFAWTVALSILWKLPTMLSLAFHCVALYVGVRFIAPQNTKADSTNFILYSVWFSIVHILPAYFRFVVTPQAISVG